MRKIFLWAMLVIAFCSAGIASAFDAAPSEVFTSFGLYKVYSNDNPVLLRADGEPYYSNVHSLVCAGLYLAARVSDDYSGIVPSGTLTVRDTGMRYPLAPYKFNSNILMYYAGSLPLSYFAGQNVIWNIFTSPDVIAGGTAIPSPESLAKSVAVDEVVPYVRISHADDSIGTIGRIDISFVKSGDWNTAVLPPVSTVRVYVNGSSFTDSDPYTELTFTKPVRKSFNFGMSESLLQSLAVEYEKDGANYIWNFKPANDTYSSIEWGKLALENMPLSLKAGASLSVDVKLPAYYDIAEYFSDFGSLDLVSLDLFTIGNSSILSIDADSVTFTKGSSSWSGLTLNETKSTLSFTIRALQMGRTTLALEIPGLWNKYYREVRVTNNSGKLTLPSGNPSGTYLKINDYSYRSRILNGRPYYPSAEFDEMDVVMIASSDETLNGFFGLTSGTWTEIHQLTSDNSGEYNISYTGTGWNTADSSDNTESPGMSITLDKVNNASVWWEFPNNPGLNVASASLKAVISGDFLTDNTLPEFAPYFEMKHDPENIGLINSLNVYFVNPDSLAKVTPDISDAVISYYYDWNTQSSDTLTNEGKSLPISYDVYESGNYDCEYHDTITISYVYNGINYTWKFQPMNATDSYGCITDFAMTVNSTQTLNAGINSSSDLEAVDFMIWEKEVISAEPVNFAPADAISFDVAGISTGSAKASLVFTQNDGTSYDKYSHSYVIIHVASSDEETDNLNMGSSDLKPEFIALTSYASIVEGKPIYYYSSETANLYVNLNRAGYMPSYYAYNNSVFYTQSGTLHVYSNDEEIDTQEMYPYVLGYYYDEHNAEYIILSYGSFYLPEGTTRIEWTASSDIITGGSADVSELTARPASEQLLTYKPCIKINREGLNVSTLEYYFADSQDNKITTPDSVSSVDVYIGSIVNSDDSGVITLNMPEINIASITFNFVDDGVNYSWVFSPVDNPAQRYSSDVMSWDVSSPDLPLVMRAGDTAIITLTLDGLEYPTAFSGNPEVVSVDELSCTENSSTVLLTALSAGMTSITLTDGANMSWPREIWVADESGAVPHLTDDIDSLINAISSGTSGGLESSGSSSDSEPAHEKPDYETGDTAAVLEGLSVYPRFALPADPSGDTYDLAWQKVYEENSPYGAFMFEDDVNVLASRDAADVFAELSMDLISREPAQLLAVVLPELEITAEGRYTFRIPVDNIVLPGTKFFMHEYWQYDYSANEADMDYYTDDGTELEYISGDEYVNVSVHLRAGTYTPVFTAAATSNDIWLIKGISADVSPDLSPDVSPDLSPDVSPDVPPDVSPDVPPDVSPDVSPDITPGTESGDTPSPRPQPGSDEEPDNPGGGSSGGGSSGGGSTEQDTENVMIPAAPTKPSVDVDDSTLIERIISAITSLSSRILGNYEVLELPDDASGTRRYELSDEELAKIPSTETPVIILPLMRVDKAAVYVFGVSITNLQAGARLFLYMMPEYVSSSSEFRASATDYDAYMFIDDNGNQVTTLPANRHVNIAVYMEPDVVYGPVITTTAESHNPGGDSGGGKTSDDHSGGSTSGDNTGGSTENFSSSGGGGGCSTGSTLTVFMLALAAFMLTESKNASHD